MLKKNIFLAIALLAVGLAAVPQVQAQTRQQQQELEQIARRSVNGLSTQDRQRVIQIMTDVYVAQGMSRQQAATLAEMAADSMFSSDIGEMTPEQRRQFEEQERSLAELEQRQQQPQQQQTQTQPGEIKGWPTAQLRERGFANLQQPTGTQASYNGSEYWAEIIYLTGANANTLQALKRQIETIAGKTMDGSGNKFSVMYRQSGSGRMSSQSYIDIELSGTQIKISFRESGA
jgi:hypothetical protein